MSSDIKHLAEKSILQVPQIQTLAKIEGKKNKKIRGVLVQRIFVAAKPQLPESLL